jgi:hypothetical protein
LFAHDSDGLIAHPMADDGPTTSTDASRMLRETTMLPTVALISPIEAGFGMPPLDFDVAGAY